jgi:hypothetical protein
MSQLMDEILRKVRELSDSERLELLRVLNSSEQQSATQTREVELARSIRGKYAHIPTSSSRFNRRKRDEIKLEDRRTSPQRSKR